MPLTGLAAEKSTGRSIDIARWRLPARGRCANCGQVQTRGHRASGATGRQACEALRLPVTGTVARSTSPLSESVT